MFIFSFISLIMFHTFARSLALRVPYTLLLSYLYAYLRSILRVASLHLAPPLTNMYETIIAVQYSTIKLADASLQINAFSFRCIV
uniref:Putative secreted protein n=1 Tax=Anopheles darlingi TaxID=43151 RepID=A0A2M4CKT1_ANODA